VPRSRIRRKEAFTPPPTRSGKKAVSQRWVAPAMVIFFVLGLLWLAVYYISNGDLIGMREIGAWNLAIGFALIMVGFALSTQWR
jgi:hypothetical protein